jgi:predicted nucleic acid-binding protein
MSYILDADWAIQALAGRPHAFHTLAELAPEGIAISFITIGEIYEGAFGFPDPETHLNAFREFLKPLRTLTLDDAIMERFAQLRSTLRKQGQLIPDFDLLLAATALRYDLTVLTFNVRHLTRIPHLTLYQVK